MLVYTEKRPIEIWFCCTSHMVSLFKRFFTRKGSSAQLSLGIEIAPNGIGVAIVERGLAVPNLNHCAFLPCATGEWGDVLQAFCKEHGLKKVKTYIAFHPQFYNLMLIDAPDVPDEELREAVKWRVNDFVVGAIEDFIVDAFRLPEDAYRGRMDMIYAAYIEKSAVLSVIALCDELEIELVEVGISELARARLLKGREALDGLGIAYLHLEEKKGQIDLLENGNLYLTRGIDIGYSMLDQGHSEGALSLDNSSQVDSLTLDIQRSLDYYESQLGKSGVSRLFVLTAMPLNEAVYASLSEKLPVRVEPFNLNRLVKSELDFSTFMDSCSVAVGATLGVENVSA